MEKIIIFLVVMAFFIALNLVGYAILFVVGNAAGIRPYHYPGFESILIGVTLGIVIAYVLWSMDIRILDF